MLPTWPRRSSAARFLKARGLRPTRSSSRVTIRAPTRATTCCPTARRRRSAGTRSTRSIRAPIIIGAGPYSPDPAYYMNYLYDTTTPDRTQLDGGDSGSPSFIVTGSPGVMYLAGAHYLTSPGLQRLGHFPAHVVADARWLHVAGRLSALGRHADHGPLDLRPVRAPGARGGNWSSGAVPNDVLTSGQVTHVRLGSVRRTGQFAALHHAQRQRRPSRRWPST